MKNNEKGQIVIMVGAFMFILLALFALAADVGIVYLWEKRLQRSTDAATLAGGQDYQQEYSIDLKPQAEAQEHARAIAIQYMGLNWGSTDNVTVSFLDELNDKVPGTDGIAETVQVDATDTVPLMFAKLLGIHREQIAASAAARINIRGGSSCGPPESSRPHPW
ncbi:MAG: pilus assembly protein TadG-related protein [bacterium]